MRYDLDANVLVSLFTTDALSVAAERFMNDIADTILVSDFARAEFVAVIGRLCRSARLTPALADDILAAFDTWIAAGPNHTSLTTADVAWSEGTLRRFDLNLHAPDALHIAIARRLDANLVTFDRRMEQAARSLGVATEGIVP